MQGKPHYTNGKRFAIVLTCSILSSVALMSTVFVAAAVFLGPLGILLFAATVFAWTAFFIMCIGWIRDKQVARYWSIPGAATGIGCSIYFAPMAWPTYITATALGLYLTYFHLSRKQE